MTLPLFLKLPHSLQSCQYTIIQTTETSKVCSQYYFKQRSPGQGVGEGGGGWGGFQVKQGAHFEADSHIYSKEQRNSAQN